MIDSCETMRTAFHLEASPVPMQLVHASVEPSLTVLDAVGNAETANEWFERERGSRFDWGRPGLIRSAAHRIAAERIILSLSFHHAIIDRWSLSLLVRDLLLSDIVSGVFTHSREETEDAEALVGMVLQFKPHRVRIGTQTWLKITEEVSRVRNACGRPSRMRHLGGDGR